MNYELRINAEGIYCIINDYHKLLLNANKAFAERLLNALNAKILTINDVKLIAELMTPSIYYLFANSSDIDVNDMQDALIQMSHPVGDLNVAKYLKQNYPYNTIILRQYASDNKQ